MRLKSFVGAAMLRPVLLHGANDLFSFRGGTTNVTFTTGSDFGGGYGAYGRLHHPHRSRGLHNWNVRRAGGATFHGGDEVAGWRFKMQAGITTTF